MRIVRLATAVATAAVLSLGPGLAAQPASATTTTTVPRLEPSPEPTPSPTAVGAIAVQLVDVAGAPLPLAGVVANVYVPTNEGGGFRYATSDTTGRIVLADLPPSSWYNVTVVPPRAGAATYAPAEVDSVEVTADATHAVRVTMAVGATVTGRLVGPDGAALVGTTVSAEGKTALQQASATTDADGRYTLVGLGTDAYELAVDPPRSRVRLTWLTRVGAEQPGRAPSRVALSTRMVHSTYDLGVGIGVPADTHTVVGATVRVTDTRTGSTSVQRTGGVAGYVQVSQFVVPTGDYTIRIDTVATPTTPARTWWWTGQSTPLSLDPGAAITRHVDFGGYSGSYAAFPRSA